MITNNWKNSQMSNIHRDLLWVDGWLPLPAGIPRVSTSVHHVPRPPYTASPPAYPPPPPLYPWLWTTTTPCVSTAIFHRVKRCEENENVGVLIICLPGIVARLLLASITRCLALPDREHWPLPCNQPIGEVCSATCELFWAFLLSS